MSHTAYLLLALLLAGPRHGYQLKHMHDQGFPCEPPLAFGQVYATLQRLEARDLAARNGHVQKGGPRRTLYAVTEVGEQAVTRWVTKVDVPPDRRDSSLLVSKTLAALTAFGRDQAKDFLRRQRETDALWLRELVASESSSAANERIALDLALARAYADITWMTNTLQRL
ncbi:PadR family transcriptional regulator [Streptomyces diacarni]|uniref:PadR family transcriptional regulator n=1 Tax=Streptomyces diacarni TaxID=2800381 RepID=UPI0034118ACD